MGRVTELLDSVKPVVPRVKVPASCIKLDGALDSSSINEMIKSLQENMFKYGSAYIQRDTFRGTGNAQGHPIQHQVLSPSPWENVEYSRDPKDPTRITVKYTVPKIDVLGNINLRSMWTGDIVHNNDDGFYYKKESAADEDDDIPDWDGP